MPEIKTDGNESKTSDQDQTRVFDALFITHATWHHLGGRSKIQWPRINHKNSHPMHFIRAVDRGLIEDRTITPKSSFKLRCSSTM